MHNTSKNMQRLTRLQFDYKFRVLQSFLSANKEFLDKHWVSESHKIENELSRLSGEAEDRRTDDLYDSIVLHRDQIPNLSNSASILIAYAFLEDELLSVCKCYRTCMRLQLSVSDMAGSGVKAYRNYLKKVAGLELNDDKAWSRIDGFRRIRNLIAHRSGQLAQGDHDQHRTEKFVDENPKLFLYNRKIDPKGKKFGSVEVKAQAVEELECTIGEYMSEVYDAWEKQIAWSAE